MKTKAFGTSIEEEKIEDKIKAREIVQSVLQYGVNQQQIEQIIYLFSMELENVNLMKDLTNTINQSRKGTKSNIITGE
jgi:long-subunit acyl-CoA synthetase (AMP-forming)